MSIDNFIEKHKKPTSPKTNKLFSILQEDSGEVSRVRINREYLLSKKVAKELNTYISFTPFSTFNDAYNAEYKNGKEVFKDNVGPGTPGVRSIFNKAGAVLVGTSTGKTTTKEIINKGSEWRIGNNVPLMDSPETRKAIKENSGCSIKELVDASQKGLLGREMYDYSDFMYCKHLGKISNNYLITLRRFPLPVDDYISTTGIGNIRSNKQFASQNVQSIGCLVNWMGTPGNEMSNILQYSFNMSFQEKKAEWQSLADPDGVQKPLNGIAAMFDPAYRKQYELGQASGAANGILGRFLKVGDAPYPAREFSKYNDQNKIYGPVDVIKTTHIRGEEGLQFNQDITVTFDYELRSYNGINTRQAFLDLLSNILNVTYSTGTFWGGGFRSMGAHQNNIFNNLNMFKAHGGAANFWNAFAKDCSNLNTRFENQFNIKYKGDWWNMIKSSANSLLGMVLGGVLNEFGRPAKQFFNSLLSPAPVGFWHLTIGNPHHPIMSIGNMILTNTTIEHYGPLGLDDFPTGIKVTCTLKRGKSRDIRDIEKIYMKGNDRIYTSMGPKIFDMYKHAPEYKSSNPKTFNNGSNNLEMPSTSNFTDKIGDSIDSIGKEVFLISKEALKNLKNITQKYFGHTDTYSIYVSSTEQDVGSYKEI